MEKQTGTPEWLRAQEETALQKGNTVIIFFAMKQKLGCFYLKIKCNPQKQAQTLQQARAATAAWSAGLWGLPAKYSIFKNVFLLAGFFSQNLHTGESQAIFSIFAAHKRQKAPPSTIFPGLGPSLQGAGSGHAPVTQQVCRALSKWLCPLGYIWVIFSKMKIFSSTNLGDFFTQHVKKQLTINYF